MTHRPLSRLRVEALEDRCTPSGTRIPAGEFNWTQATPSGGLAQLIWDGQTVVYRSRSGATWAEERVATATAFTQPSYDTRDQVQTASQSAQLVFTGDGVPHVLFLEKTYSAAAGAYQTGIAHYVRTAAGWTRAETIAPAGTSKLGPNNLVAAAGPGNSLHVLFTESDQAAGIGTAGAGRLLYATNKGGGWAVGKVADTGDLSRDVAFLGARWAPRFLSLAVDAQGAAHVSYASGFYIAASFSTVYSELRYATNAGGAWTSELVFAPPDGTGDAGLGASVAVAPNGQVSIAGYYVDRVATGSPLASELRYYSRNASGAWSWETVTATPDGYVGADGPTFTGFAPQLLFDAAGRPVVVFSDEAASHLAVSVANEFAGQIRVATKGANGAWAVQTAFRQTDPLRNQTWYPVAVQYNGKLSYYGLTAASTLDANRDPVRTDFALVEIDAPTTPPAGPAVPGSGDVITPAPPATTPGPVYNSGGPSWYAADQVTPPYSWSYSYGGTTPPATAAWGAPATDPAARPVAFVVAPDAGRGGPVAVYRSDGSLNFTFFPFGAGYTGGVRVARADVTGDGIDDIVVGSGPGMPSRVQVWDGATRQKVYDVDPFEGFTGGVFVAAGDMDGDGAAEFVVVPDAGGGPRVQLHAGRSFGLFVGDFFGIAYSGFRGGLRVAMGDVNRDGFADLLVAPGLGGGPVLSVFDGGSFRNGRAPAAFVDDFFVLDPGLRSGLYLGVSDVDGDGYGDIIVGAGKGAGPLVRVVSGKGLVTGRGMQVLSDFFAGDSSGRDGVRVAGVDLDGDGRGDLLAGAGDGSRVSVYSGRRVPGAGALDPMLWFDAFGADADGVYVG